MNLFQKIYRVITHRWFGGGLDVEEKRFGTFEEALKEAETNDGHAKVFNDDGQLVVSVSPDIKTDFYA